MPYEVSTIKNRKALSRIFGRIFNTNRYFFTLGADAPGFLLQPFRKPKRIRTAFSPSQLLKLEHAFEKNHYVVGAERKQLAQSLSLSETQVNQIKYHPKTHLPKFNIGKKKFSYLKKSPMFFKTK